MVALKPQFSMFRREDMYGKGADAAVLDFSESRWQNLVLLGGMVRKDVRSSDKLARMKIKKKERVYEV